MTLILETQRVRIRTIEETDAHNLFLLDGDSEVREFFPDGPLTRQQVIQRIEDARLMFQQYGFSKFLLEDKETGEFLGRSGFDHISDGEVGIGYLFLKKFWGLGYATEVTQSLIEWGLTTIPSNFLLRNRLISCVSICHLKSQRVLEKCGMSYYKTELYKGREYKFYEIRKIADY